MIPFLMFAIQNTRFPNKAASSADGDIISDQYSLFEDITVSINSDAESMAINVIPTVLVIFLRPHDIGLDVLL